MGDLVSLKDYKEDKIKKDLESQHILILLEKGQKLLDRMKAQERLSYDSVIEGLILIRLINTKSQDEEIKSACKAMFIQLEALKIMHERYNNY